MKRDQQFRYITLAKALRDQIMTGYIQPGQFLLSENELCRHYGLSRTSVRKALDQLQEEGLIVKRVGQGTIVSPDLVISDINPTTTLRILATSPSYFADYALPIIEQEFKRRMPHVDVRIMSLPNQSFHHWFETSRELGFKPDLLFVSDKQYHELQTENSSEFLPLEPVIKDSLAVVYPRLLQGFGGDNALAAPVSFSPIYLAYNPEMFRRFDAPLPRSGWSLEEFYTAAHALTRDTDGNGIMDTYGIALSSAMTRWPAIAMRNGIRFQVDDDSGSLQKSLTAIHDMLFRERIATLVGSSWLNTEVFIREKTGMVLTTAFEQSTWKQRGISFDPLIASMPFGDDPSSLLIANAFMIPQDSENHELAMQFLSTALSENTQMKIGQSNVFLSVLPSVNEFLLSKEDVQTLGLSGSTLDSSLFLHEMLPDLEDTEELERQMALFWVGLESADQLASRLQDIIHQR
ncbi:hypothetical protein JCM10914A_01600 [Paenibacillus sp. JCM 10914]|uniref:extracellular solute-binding protein n=1 Tax=Paenibacillus sp. JCM 10914 TaxID=1236974 RepID=UPI0003CC25FC|nr:extracellular solute-binding protein [Paenibacillus sp. JCM 10914]GAE06911.1 hypothetical protein JCM10914_3104 [Paenibacillus sp. JCM 10914]